MHVPVIMQFEVAYCDHIAMCRFDGFAEETVTVQRLPGWFKQRSNRLYPVRALMRWILATTGTWLV